MSVVPLFIVVIVGCCSSIAPLAKVYCPLGAAAFSFGEFGGLGDILTARKGF